MWYIAHSSAGHQILCVVSAVISEVPQAIVVFIAGFAIAGDKAS